MASYFARVELHGASWPNDYIKLHTSLGKIGFSNCMSVIDNQKDNQKNVNRQLPTGFYYCPDSSANHTTITASVKKAADATGYKSEIVVIGSGVSLSYLSKDCAPSSTTGGDTGNPSPNTLQAGQSQRIRRGSEKDPESLFQAPSSRSRGNVGIPAGISKGYGKGGKPASWLFHAFHTTAFPWLIVFARRRFPPPLS
jgi:hypothetical protein